MHVERRAVLPDMRRVARTWDRANTVFPQHPGERHLRRGGVMPRSDGAEHRVSEDPPLLDRGIGHDWHSAALAPWQQIVFDAAVFQIVEHLVRAHFAAARNVDETLHVGEVEVTDPPVADL